MSKRVRICEISKSVFACMIGSVCVYMRGSVHSSRDVPQECVCICVEVCIPQELLVGDGA